MRRTLLLVTLTGCTDLGGAPPDGPPPTDAAPDGGPPMDAAAMLCDAEIDHVPADAATDGVSFRDQVAPIFSRKCDFGGCHSKTNSALGLALAEGVAWRNLVCVRARGAPLNRVEKGSPERSYLVHKLLGTQLEVGGAGHQMPLGREPLGEIEMGRITDWIRAGAKDD